MNVVVKMCPPSVKPLCFDGVPLATPTGTGHTAQRVARLTVSRVS